MQVYLRKSISFKMKISLDNTNVNTHTVEAGQKSILSVQT